MSGVPGVAGAFGAPGGAGSGSASPAGSDLDRRHMRRALELAARGWGRTSPNPLVGAVVVREGRVVGEGHHAEFGGPHAEVVALRSAGDAARGGTLYVTLEPCDHRGKTPACTEAILEAGIARVVYACGDPHPLGGGGGARLGKAGVEVRGGVESEAARRLNAPFFWRYARDAAATPFVALKLALSLDGRIAAREGARTPVTGEEAWRAVHRLRAGFDAVLVGRRTAQVDDPLLTARGEVRPRRPPTRVVLDSGLRLGPDSALARTAGEAPVWAAAAPGADPGRRAALEAKGVRVLEVPRGDEGGLDLERLTRRLGDEGVGSVLAEGGGRVASSLLRSNLVRRLYLFYAPVLFGSDGVPAFPDGPAWPAGAWRTVERRSLGDDTLLVLEPGGLDAELGGDEAPSPRA